MKNEEVCSSKILYDTEFEAEITAARLEGMVPYRCPGTAHYHLTHKEKNKRRGFGHRKGMCPKCGLIRNRHGLNKHIHKCKGERQEGLTYGNIRKSGLE